MEKNPDEIAAEALDLGITCAYVCEQEGWHEGVQQIEQWLLDKFPPQDDFVLKVFIHNNACGFSFDHEENCC